MRIVIHGNSTPEELRQIFGKLMKDFEQGGVDCVPSVNIYLNVMREWQPIIVTDEVGTPLEVIEILGGPVGAAAAGLTPFYRTPQALRRR